MTEHRYSPPPTAPSSPELEQSIIGAAQLHPENFHTANKIFGDTEVFFIKQHSEIWHVLKEWHSSHECRPDNVWMVSQLGFDGLNTLAAECVSVAALSPNVPVYCKELARLWALRTVRDHAVTLAHCCDKQLDRDMVQVLREIGATVRTAGLVEGAK